MQAIAASAAIPDLRRERRNKVRIIMRTWISVMAVAVVAWEEIKRQNDSIELITHELKNSLSA